MEQKLSHKKVNEKKFVRNVVFRALFACEMGGALDVALIDMISSEIVSASNNKISLSDEAKEAIIKKVTDIISHKGNIDGMIEKNLVGWKLERLSAVDLSVLRMSVYDLLYSKGVPENVVISEAVLLAADFCDEKSKKFINGILSSVLEDMKADTKAEKETADSQS